MKILKKLMVLVVKQLVKRGITFPLIWLIAREMDIISSTKYDKILLALSPVRFMGDLKLLADSGFKIILLPSNWQFSIIALCGKKDKVDTSILDNIFASIKKRYGIDAVISTSFWYKFDISWGVAATNNDTPFIVLHKESFKPEPAQLAETQRRAKILGDFKGEHMIVHNEIIRDAIIQSGYLKENDISSLGCMRMDDFVNEEFDVVVDCKGDVVLFSFSQAIGLDGLVNGQWPKNPFVGWVKLFENTHAAFAQAALKNPDVNFLIKPKWGGAWVQKIRYALEAHDLNLDEISNLKIVVDVDAHTLIRHASIICGFGSTCLLEAGIKSKSIVIPDFDEAISQRYLERVKLRDSYSLFHVASSPQKFVDIIGDLLEDPESITTDLLNKRKELFNTWVSKIEGNATSLYSQKIRSICK